MSAKLMLGLALVAGTVGWAFAADRRATPPAPAPAPATAPTTAPATAPAASAFPAELRQQLVGRWLRPDGGYILTIQAIGEDGKAAATYANPNPIKVSRALLASREGQPLLFVELRDQGYPGNFYVLRHDPAKDQLTGVYNQLGSNQQFEIFFQRLPNETAGKQ